jgi:hypothetical protein
MRLAAIGHDAHEGVITQVAAGLTGLTERGGDTCLRRAS